MMKLMEQKKQEGEYQTNLVNDVHDIYLFINFFFTNFDWGSVKKEKIAAAHLSFF
jgi:hypothetical protein